MFIIFDKSNPDSFANVEQWMKEVNEQAQPTAVKMLIGNKADLESAVDYAPAKEKASQYGLDYIETSAKQAYQVDAAFINMASQLVSKRRDGKLERHEPSQLKRNQPQAQNKEASCCK